MDPRLQDESSDAEAGIASAGEGAKSICPDVLTDPNAAWGAKIALAEAQKNDATGRYDYPRYTGPKGDVPCQKTYKITIGLTEHVREVHAELAKIQCPHVSQTYPRPCGWRKHLKKHHSGGAHEA